MPGPRNKGSRIALIVETEQRESPTLMYVYSTHRLYAYLYIYTPHQPPMVVDVGDVWMNTIPWSFRCFVFDNQFEVARFLLRQTKAFRKRLLLCMCPAAENPLAGMFLW